MIMTHTRAKISMLKVTWFKSYTVERHRQETDRINLPSNTVGIGNNAMLPDMAYGDDASSCQITMEVCFAFCTHVQSMPMPLYASQ